MSEYQYYEFQAIDRPLSEADRQALRVLSTRARITTTSFVNHYEWGDFSGDPHELMARWFDLHVYFANWGTRRLMMRLPKRLVDRSQLDTFLQEVDWVTVQASGDNLIVDMCGEEIEPDYEHWDDGAGWLAALAPLRADVLSGDMRLFYLVWLEAVEAGMIPDEAPEPLPGIGPVSGALEAAARFFDIDPDLVEAAAVRSAGTHDNAVSTEASVKVIAAIPETEKTALLARLIDGDPHVAAELSRKVHETVAATSKAAPPVCRTAADLRACAAAIRSERERAAKEQRDAEQRRQAEAAEQARRARFDVLRQRGTSVWREIETEIEGRNAKSYDRAAEFLSDLRALAASRIATGGRVRSTCT